MKQLTTLLLSGVLYFLCGTPSIMVQSQDLQTVMLQTVRRTEDSIVIDVSVPRGQQVQSVQLEMGDGLSRTAAINSDALPRTYWFILDGSSSMINMASSVQSSIERFIIGLSPDVEVGLMLAGESTKLFQPTGNSEEIPGWLDAYNASIDIDSCVLPALDDATTYMQESRIHHVLLVTNSTSQADGCSSDTLAATGNAIDILTLSSSSTAFWQDTVNNDLVTIRQSGLGRIDADNNTVKSFWGRPVYRLTIDSNQITLPDGQLTVILSDETTQTLDIRLPQPLPSPAEDTNNLPETVNEMVEPDDTTDTTGISQATAAPVIADNVPRPTIAVTTGESPTVSQRSANIPSMVGSDLLLPVGAGITVFIAIVIMMLMTRGKKVATNDPKTAQYPAMISDSPTIVEATMIESATEPANFYESVTAGSMYSPDMTLVEVDHNPADYTQVVTEDELIRSLDKDVSDVLEIIPSGEIIEINSDIFLLGRSPDANYTIDDPALSREHVCFTFKDGHLHIEVLTSNPVMLNDEFVKSSTALNDNDRLTLSPHTSVIYKKIVRHT